MALAYNWDDQKTRSYLPTDVSVGKRFDPARFPHGAADYATYDAATQQYVSAKSGNPWTGPIPGTNAFAIGGKWSATPVGGAAATPGGPTTPAADQPADFPKLVTTVQQPLVKDIATNMLKAQPAQAAATQTAFEKFTQQMKTDLDKARNAVPQAMDIDKTGAEIKGANLAYQNAGTSAIARTEQAIKDYEDAQRAGIQRKEAELRTYEARAQDVANRAVDYARRGIKAGMAGMGPARSTGASGALAGRYLRAYTDVNLPLQRELSGLRTGLIGEGMGLEREYLGNEQNQVRFSQALQDQFRGNTVQAAQYMQDLAMRARQMTQDEAFRFLAAETELPFLSQRLRAGEISIAQALQMLERSAVDFTYVQPYDPSRIPQTGVYDPVMPQRRSYDSPGRPDVENPYQSPPLIAPRAAPGEDWYGANNLPNPSDPNNWRKMRGLPLMPEPAPRPYLPPPGTVTTGGLSYAPGAAPWGTEPYQSSPPGGGNINGRWVGSDAWMNPAPDINPDDYRGYV